MLVNRSRFITAVFNCWSPRRSEMPQALPEPNIFPQCCPFKDRKRAAHTLSKIGRLSFLILFYASFFPSLFIFLLLLMSGKVHLYSDSIFSCSVCASNVTWRGWSVQCCTYSKWVHLRCTFLLLSLTSSPSPTPGAVHPATSWPLLGVPSPAAPSHFFRDPPPRIPPLLRTIHPKVLYQSSFFHSSSLTNPLTSFFFVLTPPSASSQLSSTFHFFHALCFLC